LRDLAREHCAVSRELRAVQLACTRVSVGVCNGITVLMAGGMFETRSAQAWAGLMFLAVV